MDSHASEYAAAVAGMQEVYGRVLKPGARVYVQPPEPGLTVPAVVVRVDDAVYLTVQYADGSYEQITRGHLAPF